jgi:hypothetical protein
VSVLSWFDGKQGPEYETARWVHDHMEDRIRAGDVVGLAEHCVALKPVKGVFCGIMLAGFLGRDEVLRDAIEELQSAVRTMPDEVCERVFAIIERGNLPIHLAKRREQFESSRASALDTTIATIRAQLATCEPRRLVEATAALLHRQPTVFELALPVTLIERAELAELGLARIRELLPALPDDECQVVIDKIRASGLRIETRDKVIELSRRRQLAALAADATSEPRHPALEAALDVDDVAGYAVLGDFLHDHPRGELIALQLRAEDHPSIAADAQIYLETHAEALLGSLAAHRRTREHEPRPAFTWRRGFIDRIRIAIEYLDQPGDPTSAQLLHRVFAHPAGRFLRGVDVSSSSHSGYVDDLIDVIANHHSAVLREVFLDVIQRDQYSDAGHIEPLWRVPQLRSVRVHGAMVDPGTIAHPLLERAAFTGTTITAQTLRAIANARWPRIRHLEVGSNRRNASALEGFEILLGRRDLPELTHLGLSDTRSTDDLCRLLVSSPLAAQLRSLDLSFGSMTDLGASTLSSLPHLETLVVSSNALSPAGVATLQAAFHHVVAGGQQDLDDDDDDDY